MTNNYVTPEVLEIGEAAELILGTKWVPDLDEFAEAGLPDGDFDD
jgi:hypothetical protein